MPRNCCARRARFLRQRRLHRLTAALRAYSDQPRACVLLVYNVSYTLALYWLFVVYLATKSVIARHSPVAKFVAVKGIVFATYYQSLAVAFFPGLPREDGTRWNDFILCVEMIGFAGLIMRAFCWREYVTGVPDKRWLENLKGVVSVRDVVQDIRHNFVPTYQVRAGLARARAAPRADATSASPGCARARRARARGATASVSRCRRRGWRAPRARNYVVQRGPDAPDACASKRTSPATSTDCPTSASAARRRPRRPARGPPPPPAAPAARAGSSDAATTRATRADPRSTRREHLARRAPAPLLGASTSCMDDDDDDNVGEAPGRSAQAPLLGRSAV